MCCDNYQIGYYCQYCGTFVPFGTYHYCLNNWTTPITQIGKYYKCPKCKGEFSEPVFKSGAYTETINKYVCPFCGEEMKGLNQ